MDGMGGDVVCLLVLGGGGDVVDVVVAPFLPRALL